MKIGDTSSPGSCRRTGEKALRHFAARVFETRIGGLASYGMEVNDA